MRKAALAIEILHQLARISLQFLQSDRSGKCRASVSADCPFYPGGVGQRILCYQQTRPQRATPVVYLGLRQVETILSLNVSRTHVISDRIAEDLSTWRDAQRQLRFWDRPVRIRADRDL